MGCEECDKMDTEGKIYYLRFGKANVGIIACSEHFKQIREKLFRGEHHSTCQYQREGEASD